MMSDLKFSKATNLRNCIRIIESLSGEIEIIGAGEDVVMWRRTKDSNLLDIDGETLTASLGSLSIEENDALKELYL